MLEQEREEMLEQVEMMEMMEREEMLEQMEMMELLEQEREEMMQGAGGGILIRITFLWNLE